MVLLKIIIIIFKRQKEFTGSLLSLTRLKSTTTTCSQTTKWASGSRVSTAPPTSGPWRRPVCAVVSEHTSDVQSACDSGCGRWALVNRLYRKWVIQDAKGFSVIWMPVTIAPFSSLQADLSQEVHVQDPEQLYLLWEKGKAHGCGMGFCGTISGACKMLPLFLSKWTVNVQALNKNCLNSSLLCM